MRAVTFSQFGPPDVLVWSDAPTPEPEPHQVRIRTRTVSVNPVDAKIRRGELEAFFPTRFPAIPGSDIAGVVDLIGDAVTDVVVGDAIFGLAVGGAYAEQAVLDEYARKPQDISWELAACLPVVGEAALRLLEQLSLTTGDTLLIFGAAGSVGSLVTQLALRDGIHIIGAVGESDLAYAESLGATPVRYGDGLVARVREITPNAISGALDTSGAGVLRDAIELTGSAERVITTADARAGEYGARFSIPTRASESVNRAAERGVNLMKPDAAPAQPPLQTVLDAHATKPLVLRLAGTYPLPAAAKAHRDLEAGPHGKLVLETDR